MKNEIVLAILFWTVMGCFLFFIYGCASAPKVVYKTQEVKIPVKCNVTIPEKPKYNGTFDSARKLGEYYLEIEDLLKICTE